MLENLYLWHQIMEVQIYYINKIRSVIQLYKGTRQGGLTPSFLFNLFYQNMVHMLNSLKCGVTNADNNYIVFAYASTSQTGLQRLIDKSVQYIPQHGLRYMFN